MASIMHSTTEPKLPSAVSSNEDGTAIMPTIGISPTSVRDMCNPQPYTPGTDGIQVGESSKSAKTVEIGWNIPVTTEANSMKFEVSFTMHNVLPSGRTSPHSNGNRSAKKNQVPIGTVTGTVHFPEGITGKTSWAWLHTERTSETKRESDGSYTFTAYNIRTGDYLDVVAAFDSSKAGDMPAPSPVTISTTSKPVNTTSSNVGLTVNGLPPESDSSAGLPPS